MARFRYQHIKSSVEGKAPTAAQIKVAEIGVNDFAGDEKLFIKNSESDVVDFPRGYSREYIDEIDRVTAEALTDLNERKLDASAYTPTDLSNYYTKDETSGATEIQNALDGKADESDIPSVDGYADSVKYNSETHYVEFYHGTTAGTKVFEYDASPFLIDGMVESVLITSITSGVSEVQVLEITWNSAAGSQVTDIPLSDIFDPNLYYTKSETSGATEISTALTNKADTATTYTKTEVDTALTRKVNTSDIDQAINSTTSASTNPVSTSAVYGFVTSYTPSITVDQVLDETTSASTNPIATMAVYGAVSDLSGQSETVAAALVDLNSEHETIAAALVDLNSEHETIAAALVDLNSEHETIATALVDLDERIVELSGRTPIVAVDEVIDNTTSGSSNPVATKAVYDALIENEEIVSAALSDLEDNKLDASAYTPTDLSNYYTKSETSGATEISTALAGKVDTATFTGHTADTSVHFTTGAVQTQIDNSISGKVNTSDIISAITPSNSGSTAPIATKVVAENELVMANALNDLETNKLDASAYTPTDLSDYYTSAQTEAAISSAISGKVDTTTFDEIVGSGYTNTTITEVIENMDNAIAAALINLNDKVGDIEAILATI